MTRQSILAAAAIVYLSYMVVRNISVYSIALMRYAITPDVGWLLQTGRHIVAQRAIPADDIFSWTMPDREWLLYQWLFEAVLAVGDRLFGMDPLIRATIVIYLVVFVFLPMLAGVHRRVPLFLTLLLSTTALFIASINLGLRPMVPTTLFLATQYVLMLHYRRGNIGLGAVALVVAPMYALWGNMHTGVVLGLFSFAVMALGDALERRGLYRFTPMDPAVEGQPAAPRGYAILFAVGFAASLLNPYGYEIYVYLAELSLKRELNAWILELQPLSYTDVRNQLFLVLVASGAALLFHARRVYSAQELIHLLVFSVATLLALRFIVWATMFYAFILPKALYHAWYSVKHKYPLVRPIIDCVERWRDLYAGATVVAGLALTIYLVPIVQPARPGDCSPMVASIAAYENQRREGDRLFNDPGIGSCMLYAYPDNKVFIDTRFDFYGEPFSVAALNTLKAAPGWGDYLNRWGIDVVMVRNAWPLASRAKAMDGASVIYEDNAVTVVRLERD